MSKNNITDILNQLNFLDNRDVLREDMYLYCVDNGYLTFFSEKEGEWVEGGTHDYKE